MSRAGWAAPVDGLADAVRALIDVGKVPGTIDIAAVEAAARKYGALMPPDKPMPPTKAARKIERLISQIDTLCAELVQLPFEISDALALAGARPDSAPVQVAVPEARAALTRLAGALELARREIEDAPKLEGRPASKRATLVLDLAAIVEEAGGVAHARQAGPLVKLFETILKRRGERFGEAAQIVEKALAYRKP